MAALVGVVKNAGVSSDTASTAAVFSSLFFMMVFMFLPIYIRTLTSGSYFMRIL